MKPTCDCGGELEYYEIRSIEKTHQIRKDGRISKRFSIERDGGSFMASGLHCKKCESTYEVDMGTDLVIIRGDRL